MSKHCISPVIWIFILRQQRIGLSFHHPAIRPSHHIYCYEDFHQNNSFCRSQLAETEKIVTNIQTAGEMHKTICIIPH